MPESNAVEQTSTQPQHSSGFEARPSTTVLCVKTEVFTSQSFARCHWTRPPSSPTSSPTIDAAAAATDSGRHRWGSVEEVETSFRERSPNRSPFRNLPVTQSDMLGPQHPECRPSDTQRSAAGITWKMRKGSGELNRVQKAHAS